MRKLFALIAFVGLAAALGAVEPPHITSVTPPSPIQGPKPQLMKVVGLGFAAGLAFEVTTQGNTEVFSGPAIQAQGNTSFEISLVLAHAGTSTMVVRNKDGGVSEPFALKVELGQPAQPSQPLSPPTIERVSPETATKGGTAQTVTLTGRNFAPEATVTVTDPTGTVTVVKGSALGAVTSTVVQISVVLDVSGDYTFVVTNPPGQASNTITVAVS